MKPDLDPMTSIDPVQVGREAAAKMIPRQKAGGRERIIAGHSDKNPTVAACIAGATEMLARMGGAEGRVHIVFDGPPGPTAGRFVEVETPDGRSISFGEWHERKDGLWELRIPVAAAPAGEK